MGKGGKKQKGGKKKAQKAAPSFGKATKGPKREAGPGKKGKKPSKRNWRKADVEDVEEAMEDERLVAKLKKQAMKGGTGAEDDVDALFTVDTKGSCEGLSASSRREVARAKLFPKKGPNIGMSAYEEAKVARAGEQMQANRKQKRPAPEPEVFDLWSLPTSAEKRRREAADDEVGAFHIRKRTKPAPDLIPKTMHQKASVAPAVIPAHEGQSVNPDSDAFEDLACMAAARQLEREEEAAVAERKMRPMTEALRHAVDNLDGMDEEAKVALYRKIACSQSEQQEGESDEAFVRRTARKWQKSQAKRNKERRRKITNNKEEQLRAQQKLEKSVGEIGSILKSMKEEESARTERRAYRQAMRAQRKEQEKTAGIMDSTTRLGRNKVNEEALIVPDANARGSGLRSLPLKASAVRDRVSSIMRRGLLPSMPDASNMEAKQKKSAMKFRKKRQYMSPLLKDNVLLR
eukprot:TRINITY_DN78927_c1_g1_i1.p1 TRINITY_DN78927_c1_g1~~TRINITY_DN78927_c1_g1_i1.p1  ORF type:complete len:479 (-),score=133.94 TRINITY_DN78927_c1_g1_i1:85-1467(-)